MTLVGVPGSLDRPYWVEDAEIDLEYHIRNVTLPPQVTGAGSVARSRWRLNGPSTSRPPWKSRWSTGQVQ